MVSVTAVAGEGRRETKAPERGRVRRLGRKNSSTAGLVQRLLSR